MHWYHKSQVFHFSHTNLTIIPALLCATWAKVDWKYIHYSILVHAIYMSPDRILRNEYTLGKWRDTTQLQYVPSNRLVRNKNQATTFPKHEKKKYTLFFNRWTAYLEWGPSFGREQTWQVLLSARPQWDGQRRIHTMHFDLVCTKQK